MTYTAHTLPADRIVVIDAGTDEHERYDIILDDDLSEVVVSTEYGRIFHAEVSAEYVQEVVDGNREGYTIVDDLSTLRFEVRDMIAAKLNIRDAEN